MGISTNDKISEEEILTQECIDKLAGILHDCWRKERIDKSGVPKSQVERTTDNLWIQSHCSEEVDLANTNYKDLPLDWKNENSASVKVALIEIYRAEKRGENIDDSFIEKVSALIHGEWLSRNTNSKFLFQDMPYSELSDEEKEKDRAVVRRAIDFYFLN